ncbi:MAG: PadR family transcriptional regulator [Oscillibacter sp.]|nr:PadR family transcriptional regulator [Oscillibacter sp.]
MAREKFQTLTEQMFYILLCLGEERCGADVMAQVSAVTHGRVAVGPGTLYALLESFLHEGMIRETAAQGRKRSYILTDKGWETLENEYRRLSLVAEDYRRVVAGEGGNA